MLYDLEKRKVIRFDKKELGDMREPGSETGAGPLMWLFSGRSGHPQPQAFNISSGSTKLE